MQNEIYADAIGEITITGPIVRIDLVSLSATQRDSAGQPVPEFRQRIVMSIEGFANSYEVLQKAMNGLLDAGAIRRNVPEPAQTKAPVSLNGHGSSGSPNFA